MLDMGFIHDDPPHHRRRCRGSGRTLLFSATMPPAIAKLAEAHPARPGRGGGGAGRDDRREGRPVGAASSSARNKRALLDEVLRDTAMTRVLVFTRTKHGANRVAEQLDRSGIRAGGHPRQQVAERAAARAGRLQARRAPRAGRDRHRGARHRRRRHHPRHQLRAAQRARELRPPHRPHRAGRRARASPSRSVDREERPNLRDIERLTRTKVQVVQNHPYAA